ncbi:MAG: glycoside hydrolase family 88 protein [Bacteroidales bacterium]|nr:glycoside hydrolase family 88 protein [Bacteroidales bacterium]
MIRHSTRTGLLLHVHGMREPLAEMVRSGNRSVSLSMEQGMGWYTMAILDILDYLPAGHPDRDDLISILQKTLMELLKVRDQNSGIWYQV